MTPRVVLVGPPGAGKSTVGRLLAGRWGCAFADSDAVVEAEQGRSVASIFVEEGEETFRRWEREAVLRLLGEHDGVLALGGGAVLDPVTRRALADHRVVLLDTGIAAAAARVGLNRDRPLLIGNVRGTLAALLKDRAPLYAEVADVAIATDERTPDEVADAVEAAMTAHPEAT
jgi:shikimate kinase